ncbi:MAG: Ig-like domain-containing protein [Gemmatimonadaceae bacterium]
MRWIAALGAAVLCGCASIGSPPGGPERTTPPELVRVTPDSGAVNVRARGVVFAFDVVVNDRDVANRVLISPREGVPRVIWRRSRIEVRPRRGFRPNTAYSVTLLPGLTDLRNNAMPAGKTVVFSTGPAIPAFTVHGRVFDWPSQRVGRNAMVEVIRRPDSLPYVGAADSTGQFAVGPLDEGTYTVRAMIDNNNNRALDPSEAWDSLTVVISGTSPFVELLAAPRDTFPPRLLTVTSSDSATLTASFDRFLHPEFPLVPESFRVVNADSTPLRVMTVARADSLLARRPSLPPAPAPGIAPVAGAEPRPSKPPPSKDVVIGLDPLTPLRPGATYRVTAINARGLLGPPRTSDRVVAVPVARRDSTPPRGAVRPP